MRTIRELYNYRMMIISLVRRDLKGRYKGSVLGFLWTFVNPLLQLLVYTFVFSTIMRMGVEDYYMFLFVTLIPWIFFNTSIVGSSTCIRAQQDMVKKIYFPREVLPLSFVTSQFINMLLSFVVVFIVILVDGREINLAAVLYLPLIMLVEYFLALGIAMISSSVTVYFRDLEYILGIIMMAWQFLSPVMYGMDMVPEEVHPIFLANPMTPVIVAYRDILYYGNIPEISTLVHAIVASLILLVIGFLVFGKLKKHFAEEM